MTPVAFRFITPDISSFVAEEFVVASLCLVIKQ